MRWGKGCDGGMVPGREARPGISGPPTAAEYSVLAILSGLMTGIFALTQKVRASSLCLPSVPSQPGRLFSLGSISLGPESYRDRQ